MAVDTVRLVKQFANDFLANGDDYEDVIWTDETSECHRRHCFRKKEKQRLKPRPKHALKVRVCTGISKRKSAFFMV